MDKFILHHVSHVVDLHGCSYCEPVMTHNLSWQQISEFTGWELVRQPADAWVNWYWDCAAWSLLNTWYIPFRMPGIHSDVDRWVSQFTLNGIKASNICQG